MTRLTKEEKEAQALARAEEGKRKREEREAAKKNAHLERLRVRADTRAFIQQRAQSLRLNDSALADALCSMAYHYEWSQTATDDFAADVLASPYSALRWTNEPMQAAANAYIAEWACKAMIEALDKGEAAAVCLTRLASEAREQVIRRSTYQSLRSDRDMEVAETIAWAKALEMLSGAQRRSESRQQAAAVS